VRAAHASRCSCYSDAGIAPGGFLAPSSSVHELKEAQARAEDALRAIDRCRSDMSAAKAAAGPSGRSWASRPSAASAAGLRGGVVEGSGAVALSDELG